MKYRTLFFVISSIIGSGIFLIPYDLQTSGINSFYGMGIIFVLFSYISYLFSNTSGDSIFSLIDKNLGRFIGFSLAWIYWITASGATIIVINVMYKYLSYIFPCLIEYPGLTKSSFVIFIIIINCFKKTLSKFFEISINILKVIPLIIFPILCITYKDFNIHNISGEFNFGAILSSISQIVWGFMGIETGAIIEKSKNITLTLLSAMSLIFLIYISNLIGVFGIYGFNIESQTVFSDIMGKVLGPFGGYLFSIIIFIIALGSLNVWIISGKEIALDNVKLGYFPKCLNKENSSNIHYIALLCSSVWLIPLCFFSNHNFIINAVNIASNNSLLFYGLFCISFAIENKNKIGPSIAAIICLSLFLSTSPSFSYIFITIGIIILGYPVYYLSNKNNICN